eukprot:m.62925 g.62925  ORF g.62925 m.62925 type:complete len:65 (-) comp11544_c0_seq2:96-290(-)
MFDGDVSISMISITIGVFDVNLCPFFDVSTTVAWWAMECIRKDRSSDNENITDGMEAMAYQLKF